MQDVTKDRDKYLGGSDVPCVLNISKFKTRWRLLQEKARIVDMEEVNNAYVDFGNALEPKIREFINCKYGFNFVEDKIINGFMRYHADGVDRSSEMVLEIKTTSTIHNNLKNYDYYLCQLLVGCKLFGYDTGVLAVYERPEDFSYEFNAGRLQVFFVNVSEHKDFLETIEREISRFRSDWLKLLENPFITEEELQPNEVVEVANRVLVLEQSIALMKETEKELKSAKAELKRLMEENNIKKWETPSGIKITLVPDGDDTVVSAFNEERFKAEQPELYHSYLEDRMKPGRAGYVRISVPK